MLFSSGTTFKPHFYIFCGDTIDVKHRSGIQRVVLQLALNLSKLEMVDFVKWDAADGQLRYCDLDDLARLSLDDHAPNAFCHRRGYRFGDILNSNESHWLIFPEIPYHMSHGNDTFSRIISQFREYGGRVAAIFYDLIPIFDDNYAEFRDLHTEYILELIRCDLILPISHHAGCELVDYISGYISQDLLLQEKIASVPLGEAPVSQAKGFSQETTFPSIVLLGTIEPRKQQARFLRIFNDLVEEKFIESDFKIHVIGNVHPLSATAFFGELKRNQNIVYHQYATDQEIQDLLSSAWFSVFVSNNEGFGLPIVESLLAGTPCLTANFGSMSEIARDGGCLTVDVTSDHSIREGLKLLIKDANCRQGLRSEIFNRRIWNWQHYASAIAEKCKAVDQLTVELSQQFESELKEALEIGENTEIFYCDTAWNLMFADELAHPFVQLNRQTGNIGVIIVLPKNAARVSNLSDEWIKAACLSDIIISWSEEIKKEFIKRTLDVSFEGITCNHIIVCDQPNPLNYFSSRVSMLVRSRMRRINIARIEGAYGAFSEALKDSIPDSRLAIVISTYNREKFITKNVEWLLSQVKNFDGDVKVVVYDNASADKTQASLSQFLEDRNFVYFRNPNNVGMLGNLRVCSTQRFAKFVWLIGDDDFITDGAIGRVLAAISQNPRAPLFIHNFGVYFRNELSALDSAEVLISELMPVAPTEYLWDPLPTGRVRVNQAAGVHDNMFTAIYPLVFRSDILSATFNYPFDNVPFQDLVECVPTSKIIFETLAYCEVFWFQEFGICGNATNSWSHHRPRWHLKNMADVFDLARDGGVQEDRLWGWAKWHVDLFYEAVGIAKTAGVAMNLKLPDDIDNAERVYRRKITIDQDVKNYNRVGRIYL